MLLGLAESHQSTKSKTHDTNGDGAANAPVNILPVADFRDRGSGHGGYVFAVFHKANLVLPNEHVYASSGLGVGQRSAIISDLVTGFGSKECEWNCNAKEDGRKGSHVVSWGLEPQPSRTSGSTQYAAAETDPWCRPSQFSVTRLEPPALCGRARDRRHRQRSFLGYLRALQRALITDSHLRTMDTGP